MSDPTQQPPLGPAFDESRTTRPMPKGMLMAGAALTLLVILGGALIVSGGSEADGGDPVTFPAETGPLPGEAESQRAGESPEPEASGKPLDGMSIGDADPELLPVAPQLVDEVALLHERLATVESDLERLRQRHASLATTLDTLIAGEPWARRAAPESEVLVEAVRVHAESLRRVERRLDLLEAAHRERTRAAASGPPFELIAIDWWNGEPYATLRSQGRYTRVQEGESVSGWSLDQIDVTRRVAAFQQSGRVVRLTVQGG
jgi:hypothetical protein